MGDKNKSKGATEAFKTISTAFNILSDDEKRKNYDRFGNTSDAPRRYQQAYHSDELTPEDLFNMFFGIHPRTVNRRYRQRPRRTGQPTGEANTRMQLLSMLPLLVLFLMS